MSSSRVENMYGALRVLLGDGKELCAAVCVVKFKVHLRFQFSFLKNPTTAICWN